ncbi:hypothetical protein BTVI_56897 [Pitangus sulphuratus]|nr:hypothetical protein BTVI_56897 [Pitangus sulphuratus]
MVTQSMARCPSGAQCQVTFLRLDSGLGLFNTFASSRHRGIECTLRNCVDDTDLCGEVDREAVAAPSLEVPKAGLDGALNNLG